MFYWTDTHTETQAPKHLCILLSTKAVSTVHVVTHAREQTELCYMGGPVGKKCLLKTKINATSYSNASEIIATFVTCFSLKKLFFI